MSEDTVLKKLIEHDKRFDTLANELNDQRKDLGEFRSDFSSFRQQTQTAQDEILTIIRRLDEERVFSSRWVARMEEEISKIKTHLKI